MSQARYHAEYRRALAEPEAFWSEQAAALHWDRKWQRVLNADEAPFYRWFDGGTPGGGQGATGGAISTRLEDATHAPQHVHGEVRWHGLVVGEEAREMIGAPAIADWVSTSNRTLCEIFEARSSCSASAVWSCMSTWMVTSSVLPICRIGMRTTT